MLPQSNRRSSARALGSMLVVLLASTLYLACSESNGGSNNNQDASTDATLDAPMSGL